jgi:hypothetical protein
VGCWDEVKKEMLGRKTGPIHRSFLGQLSWDTVKRGRIAHII